MNDLTNVKFRFEISSNEELFRDCKTVEDSVDTALRLAILENDQEAREWLELKVSLIVRG